MGLQQHAIRREKKELHTLTHTYCCLYFFFEFFYVRQKPIDNFSVKIWHRKWWLLYIRQLRSIKSVYNINLYFALRQQAHCTLTNWCWWIIRKIHIFYTLKKKRHTIDAPATYCVFQWAICRFLMMISFCLMCKLIKILIVYGTWKRSTDVS